MKISVFYIFIFTLLSHNISLAQLNIGDHAPNLVLSSNNNSIQSFSFPYQNKVTLLFFWTSSVTKSKENIYKYKRLHSKYSDLAYKTINGFDVISVALQSDKVAWESTLADYKLSKFSNCISQRGYNDFFIKTYKLTETPTSFLIDEFGKIVAVNPSIKLIVNYMDEKRNSEYDEYIQTKLHGKIMLDNSNSIALTNQKIYLLNQKKDTLGSAMLNDMGEFLFKNINISVPYFFYIPSNSKIKYNQSLFLTSETGEVVSNFKNVDTGFEYELTEEEIQYLKPLFDDEHVSKKDSGVVKKLYYNDILFDTKTDVLSKQAMAKLNVLITKLNANPTVKVDIIAHTDSNGSETENTNLSTKQFNSIITYLTLKGISKTRLKGIAKGESEIINKCYNTILCSEDEHKINRRIEFKFYPIK